MKHAQEMNKMMKDLKIISRNDNMVDFIQNSPNSYRYSKYLVLDMFTILDAKVKTQKKKDAVVADLYHYASSTAEYSAPYYKME